MKKLITLTHCTINCTEQRIQFEVNSKEDISSLLLSYQQVKEYRHPKETIVVPLTKEADTFKGEVSLTLLYKKMIFDTSTTWNVMAKSGDILYEIDADLELLQQVGEVNVLQLLTLSLGKTATIQLKFNFLTINAKVETLKTTDKLTKIEGVLKTDISQLDKHNISLLAQRRPTSSLYNFHEEKFDFPIKLHRDKNKFEINLLWDELPQTFCKDDTNVCDFILTITNEFGHQVRSFLELPDHFTKELVEKQIQQSNGFCLIKPYITGSRRLSFYVIKNNKNKVELVSFSENNTHYHFKLSSNEAIKNKGVKQLVLRRKDKKGITFEHLVEMKWSVLNNFQIQIPKDSFLSVPGIIHSSSWDFFLRIDGVDYYITKPDDLTLQSDYIYVQDQNYKAKIFCSPSKNLSCYTILSDKLSPNAINVAVMGTCFSRNMFNSSLYFNPGYKQILKCSFTQFHSSIISVMTDPFVFDLDKYTDMSESERNFVKEDFSKNFFENLKKSNSEYFLIDLYPDVIRPVMWLTDRSAVTLSYVIEESELLNDLPIKRILDHTDNFSFFNEWKMYVDIFIARLTEIIPPERIILNKGRFTTMYYDKSRKKVDFPNKMMIERNNYFWDKLDNYFYSKLPKAQILDIRDKPYIGDINYPYGNSFSHYESNYYKDLFKELTHIILKERINRL